MTSMVFAPATEFVRAKQASPHAALPVQPVKIAVEQADFQVLAQHMFSLMLRNVSSDGFLFADPLNQGQFSQPGCVIAAPSYPADQPGVNQDYVFNWTRDAAVTAMEIASAALPPRPGGGVQPLIDYVRFAKTCQANATPTLGHACFTIEGWSRPWTEQSDGPALQTLAILQAFGQLDQETQALATEVIAANMSFLLGTYEGPCAYTGQTTSLWEEHSGYSFFARATQLKCMRAISANTFGIPVPPGTDEAVSWLESALAGHWDGTRYLSLIAEPPGAQSPGDGAPSDPAGPGYDPNIDIVMAAVYGAVPVTDTRLLATAAQLRSQWADSGSPSVYPINVADHDQRGIGPMMGRYPGDAYDGDTADPVIGGHPWALCTANFAELYYRLATEIARTQWLPFDDLSAPFFGQIGIWSGSSTTDAVAALDLAGDAMLQAIVSHSDNLELSEQFDRTSGYEKSARNFTWSYAAFLSAVRAKSTRHVQG
jgi:glucoamylase